VAVETAVLPAGWQERLVPVRNPNTGGGTGLCLEIHDLAVSKLVAGREKDLDFIGGLFRHQLARPETVRERLATAPVDNARRQLCLDRLKRLST
jgi:hypothetical protein